MHKITNLWKFEINWLSKLRDINERKNTLGTGSCVDHKCLILRPQINVHRCRFFPITDILKIWYRYIKYFRRARWSLNTALGILMEVEIYIPKTDSSIALHLNLFLSDPPNLFVVKTISNCASPALIISGFTTKYDRRYRWLGRLVNAHHNSRFVIGHDWPSQNDTEPLWVAWLADIKVSVADALT